MNASKRGSACEPLTTSGVTATIAAWRYSFVLRGAAITSCADTRRTKTRQANR